MRGDILSTAISTPEAATDEHGATSEYRPYGVLRSPRSVENILAFVFRSENQEAIGYAHLYQASLDPSEGVVLQFTVNVVKIREESSTIYSGTTSHDSRRDQTSKRDSDVSSRVQFFPQGSVIQQTARNYW